MKFYFVNVCNHDYIFNVSLHFSKLYICLSFYICAQLYIKCLNLMLIIYAILYGLTGPLA